MEALVFAAAGAVALVSIIIGIVVYVLVALSHMKALRMLGYHTPWHAWIPVLRYMAFADSVTCGEDITIFGQKIAANLFKFWWVLIAVADILAYVNGTLSSILSIAVYVICLGTIYIKMYARLEGKQESDVQVLGYISGWLSIIAVVKFFLYKED